MPPFPPSVTEHRVEGGGCQSLVSPRKAPQTSWEAKCKTGVADDTEIHAKVNNDGRFIGFHSYRTVQTCCIRTAMVDTAQSTQIVTASAAATAVGAPARRVGMIARSMIKCIRRGLRLARMMTTIRPLAGNNEVLMSWNEAPPTITK